MNKEPPEPQPHLWDGTPMAAMPYVISKESDMPNTTIKNESLLSELNARASIIAKRHELGHTDPVMAERAAQPVAAVSHVGGSVSISWRHRDIAGLPDRTLLYTAPPKAVPLTDEQKNAMWLCNRVSMAGGLPDDYYIQGINDAEHEHGITPATVEKG